MLSENTYIRVNKLSSNMNIPTLQPTFVKISSAFVSILFAVFCGFFEND